MNKITAEEARSIARSLECLSRIYKYIRERAELGHYNVDIGFRGELANTLHDNSKVIINELREKGFMVDQYETSIDSVDYLSPHSYMFPMERRTKIKISWF